MKPSAAVARKANLRSIQGRAPAPKGQGGIKDCLVFETYLELGWKLKIVGLAQPLVFVSSNTNDYGSTGAPKPEVQADASSVNMAFYSSLGARSRAERGSERDPVEPSDVSKEAQSRLHQSVPRYAAPPSGGVE